MRALPQEVRRALTARESEADAVMLVTIEHDGLASPLRLCDATVTRLGTDPLRYGVVSGGITYLYVPMKVITPDDVRERAPSAQIQIANVARELVPLARSTSSPARVTLQVVLTSAPDAPFMDYPPLDMVSVTYTAETMTLNLSLDGMTTEPYPAESFSPAWFPGLF